MRVTSGIKFSLNKEYEMHEGWFELEAKDIEQQGDSGFRDLSIPDRFCVLQYMVERQALEKMLASGYIDGNTFKARNNWITTVFLRSDRIKKVVEVLK